MTKQEYAAYEARVARFFEREGINDLSTDGEPYFSWRSCDCCGTNKGGTREKAIGYNLTEKCIEEYEVCTDCLYYAAYGQLDDMTMLDLTD